MRYVRLKSMTWWSGFMAICVGVASMVLPDSNYLGQVSELVSMLSGGGDASPAALIFLGSGLIGIRDKIERSMNVGKN